MTFCSQSHSLLSHHRVTVAHFVILSILCYFFFTSCLLIQTTETPSPGSDPKPSTERYRITRKELGYILGRNYRGLKKLYNIEINDALNVSIFNNSTSLQVQHTFTFCFVFSKQNTISQSINAKKHGLCIRIRLKNFHHPEIIRHRLNKLPRYKQ